MAETNYIKYLVAIGVPYSVSGKIDTNILPEKALCLASPIFYSDAKACSLVYTLLKNNFDLFDDALLSQQISYMKDKLSIAMLGGILYKASKNYFTQSINKCLTLSKGASTNSIKKSMRLLADHGRLQYDDVLQRLFGIKINEISAVDPKKTILRPAIFSKNHHFALREQNKLSKAVPFFDERDRNLYIPKTSVEKVKRDLCDQLILLAKKYSLKQKEMAVLTKSTPAQINEIINYRIERFTVDFLISKIEYLVTYLKTYSSTEEKIEIPVTIGPLAEI